MLSQTAWSWVRLYKLIVPNLATASYGTRRFIAMLKEPGACSYAELDDSSPRPPSTPRFPKWFFFVW
jgi:hypothetical protein